MNLNTRGFQIFYLDTLTGKIPQNLKGTLRKRFRFLGSLLQTENDKFRKSLERYVSVRRRTPTHDEFTIKEYDEFNDIYGRYRSFKISGEVFETELIGLAKRLEQRRRHCHKAEQKKQYERVLSWNNSSLRAYRESANQ